MKDFWSQNQDIVRSCETCQKNKVVTTSTKEKTKVLTATSLFEIVYTDICGPMRETSGRKRYILGIIDQYSKYLVLIALPKQDEETIRKAIFEKWILRFGCPREIRLDCGKAFDSRVMKEFAKKLDIKLCYSSPYHHSANGQIERQFRTIRDLVNATLRERGTSDWAELLPEIEFTMNATMQKTIRKSPAEIVFGKKISRERWQESESLRSTEESIPDEPTNRQFEVGDYVLVKLETRNKSQDRFEGPYRITEKIHERRYAVQGENGKRLERNVEKLKKFLKKGDIRE